jgi:hypothetical protein
LGENATYAYKIYAYHGPTISDGSDVVTAITPACVPQAPDLRPHLQAGHTYPLVPSSVTDTHQVGTLIAGQNTYFDWRLANSGDLSVSDSFYAEIWVDDLRHVRYPYPGLAAGQTDGSDDWRALVQEPGWHTVRLALDPENRITESSEQNNTWEHRFYWAPQAPYEGDAESGTADWTTTGLWHLVDHASGPHPEAHSGTHSWWYGQEVNATYDTGARSEGSLTSPPIHVPASDFYLRFWYWYETETESRAADQRWVQIAVDGAPFQNLLQLYGDPQAWWLQSPVIDLSAFAGHTIQVRFHMDTLDDSYNQFQGWYVDDVSISTMAPPTCTDAHEPNDTSLQATAIAYGQRLAGDICPGGDYDFYRFSGRAGDKVVIDLDAKSDGSRLDTVVALLDSDRESVLEENDDEVFQELQDSHLGYELPHDGDYYILVRAWDHPSAGSRDHHYSIELSTDHTPPASAEITTPKDGAWLIEGLQAVYTSIADHESGVSRVDFYWHSAAWENSAWVWLGTDRDPRDGWGWEFDTRELPEQRGAAILAWVSDWADNVSSAAVRDLGVDRTPPNVEVETEHRYDDAPFRDFWVRWSGTDLLAGVDQYDVQVRDGSEADWQDLISGTETTRYRFVGQDGHTYFFRARARDRAGNTSAYAGSDGTASHTVDICDVAPDAFEPDDEAGQANPVSPDGSVQTRNVHRRADADWVKFSATEGTVYVLLTTNPGGHADTEIELYDNDQQTLLAHNDDDPDRWPSSRLVWQAPRSRVYYVRIKHNDEWAYGCTTEYGFALKVVDSEVYLPLLLHQP